VLTLWQAQQLLAGRSSGFKVDRYLLLDLIGQGGMGRVYLARDTRLNRRVALKILSPERINNPRAIARFQREARVGAQLQHENLVRIYDFGESNGRYFLVMEYIEGKTIGTLISEQGAMPVAAAVRLLRQVAMGLEHAHRKGLIHRDVNPYNILVTHDGTAKLADLGLAIDLAEEDRVTREGATVGTFDYVAPEQARHSHAADIRSDIYSLGCTIYHMLTGRVPFPSPSLPEKLFSHQVLDPAPLHQLSPGLPEGLAEIVQRMMRKCPDERYATPLQVWQALEPYEDEHVGVGSCADGVPIQKPVLDSPRRPESAQPDEAVPALEVESIRPFVNTVAAPILSESPPFNGVDVRSGVDPVDSALPVPNPIQNNPRAAADAQLALDFGPPPLLSEGLKGTRTKVGSERLASTWNYVVVAAWISSRWIWGLVALTLTVLVLVGILALINPFATNWSGFATPASPRTVQKAEYRPKSSGATKPKRVATEAPEIVVRTEGENEIQVDDLLQAIEKAMGSRGWVELRNRQPLHLSSNQTLDLLSGQGPLVIRAASGVEPVIEIELKSSKPLLATGSGVFLKLSGLTIVVRYPEVRLSSLAAPAAIITAASAVEIDRCAFIVEDSPRLKGTCALVSKGSKLVVDRCWFQGFDKAIEFCAFSGSDARIQQTMIVPASELLTAGQAQQPDWHGWGVKAHVMSGGKPHVKAPERRLTLDHCTIEGAGLLELSTGLAPIPAFLQLDIKHCAVRAESILAYMPRNRAGESPADQVRWIGEGNLYDIRGQSWVVLSATQGTPALSTGIVDLDSWLLRMGARDLHPIRTNLNYRTDPASRSALLRPRDFANEGPKSSHGQPGADPEQVGPWSAR
jgi:serine/threonine-protein kinase